MHLKKLLVLSACAFFAVTPAKAEVFFWQDPLVHVSMSFPDTWGRVSAQQPDDVLTVAAPGSDYAECRLRADEDKRFTIYPREFAGAIQRMEFSKKFWDDYTGQYRAAIVYNVGDNAGLGDAFASWADVSFVSPSGPAVQKRGIAYAGVYNDHAYVLECSAANESFDKWYPVFLSVLKSVDMRDEYATSVNGHYRDFQKDGKWLIHGQKDIDTFVY